jgi:molybdopterin converting factor small subunit
MISFDKKYEDLLVRYFSPVYELVNDMAEGKEAKTEENQKKLVILIKKMREQLPKIKQESDKVFTIFKNNVKLLPYHAYEEKVPKKTEAVEKVESKVSQLIERPVNETSGIFVSTDDERFIQTTVQGVILGLKKQRIDLTREESEIKKRN